MNRKKSSEKKHWSQFLHEQWKAPLNWLYFSILFLFLGFIHLFHVFLVEDHTTPSTWFFAVHALVQCALEVLMMMLALAFLEKYQFKKVAFLFVLGTIVMVVIDYIDFPLVRLMDMTIWYALDHFVFQESLANFIELLYASNIPLMVWLGGAICFILLLVLGYALFLVSRKISRKRPLVVSYANLSVAIFSLAVGLLIWESTMKKAVIGAPYDRYAKALTWKQTFLPLNEPMAILGGSLKPPKVDLSYLKNLERETIHAHSKPDIFLFIVESLREDFVDDKVAPHLSRFKQENISFPLALANANATQLSWFSLFYSQFPLYWGTHHMKDWELGSPALLLLKKMGYEVHLYSSARLGYYGMDELIFGKDHQLATSFQSFRTTEDIEPYKADAAAMGKLIDDVKKTPSGGRVFIVFLDATHFSYSWPEEQQPKFEPIVEKINFFKIACSKENEEVVKNRYRSAFFFIDSQFNQFLSALKETPGWTDSVIVFTADHGEEFYEHGNIFHASQLTHPQTHIPLYYKLGSNEWKETQTYAKMTSHMDIFPTIFHHLFKETHFSELFQGNSIFSAQTWPYVVTARYNAISSPFEFFIHDGNEKLILRFNNENEIFKSTAFHVIGTKNIDEKTADHSIQTIMDRFNPAIHRLFTHQ